MSRRLFIAYCALIAFSTAGSVVSVAWAIDPGPVAPLAAALLILAGAGCLALEVGSWRVVALVIAVSSAAELTGLYTGLPFGAYEYTDRWWPTVPLPDGHRFPFLLPLAWVMIMAGSYQTVRRWAPRWVAVGLSAVLATVIDAPMERAMTDVFGYWAWTPPGPVFGAPIMNSVGWLLVSAIVGAILAGGTSPRTPSRAPWVLSLFCGFVAVSGMLRSLDIAWGLLLALAGVLAGLGWAAKSRAVDLDVRAVDTV